MSMPNKEKTFEEKMNKLEDIVHKIDNSEASLDESIAAKAVRGMGGAIRACGGPGGGLAIEITLRKEGTCDAENPDR